MDHSESQRLNQAAFNSLLGVDADWRANLVALLRSDGPIGWAVRLSLADAIEGESPTGVRLAVSGHEKMVRWSTSLHDRRDWLEVGRTVEPIVAAADNLLDGIADSAERLGRAESYCTKAFYYARACDRWKSAARQQGRLYRRMDELSLENEFHICSIEQKSSRPQPLSGAKYDRLMISRWREAKAVTPQWGGWQGRAARYLLLFSSRLPKRED